MTDLREAGFSASLRQPLTVPVNYPWCVRVDPQLEQPRTLEVVFNETDKGNNVWLPGRIGIASEAGAPIENDEVHQLNYENGSFVGRAGGSPRALIVANIAEILKHDIRPAGVGPPPAGYVAGAPGYTVRHVWARPT